MRRRTTDVPPAVRTHVHEFKESLDSTPVGRIYQTLLLMLHDPDTCGCPTEDFARDEISGFAHTNYEAYCSMIWRAIHDRKPGLTEYLRGMAKREADENKEARELEQSFPVEASKLWPVTAS